MSEAQRREARVALEKASVVRRAVVRVRFADKVSPTTRLDHCVAWHIMAQDPTLYRLLAACTGSITGVLVDIVQKQNACAAVKLSSVFINTIKFGIEPIYFVLLLVALGFSGAWALENQSSRKLFMYAAGLTTFLQTWVPGPLPVTGSFERLAGQSGAIDGGSIGSTNIELVAGNAFNIMDVSNNDGRQLSQIAIHFFEWNWKINRNIRDWYVKTDVFNSRIRLQLNDVDLPGFYSALIEVPGYKIVEVLPFEVSDTSRVFTRRAFWLVPSKIPLAIQRLFVVPPSPPRLSGPVPV
jgi:hypothetical protein